MANAAIAALRSSSLASVVVLTVLAARLITPKRDGLPVTLALAIMAKAIRLVGKSRLQPRSSNSVRWLCGIGCEIAFGQIGNGDR